MAKGFNLGEYLRDAGGGPTVGTPEQIEYIPLDRIDPDPENFYSLDGLDELAGNIELVGLQQPLRVRDGDKGRVIVVSGHRRRAACMMIRDGGSPMFDRGVPCIREHGESTPEMQELKLIFANSATRIMSAPELSRQTVRTRDLLARLKAGGYEFQGRTRELVASVLQTSDSRVGRLTAIREKLVPELLKYFDDDKIGETVAYRLSQEERTTQLKLAIRLGPAVQGLTKDGVEAVIDQAKKDTPSQPAAPAAPPEGEPRAAAKEFDAIDGLKKYLDGRHEEDQRFWQYMQKAADSLILHSFASGALPIRKDNIDMLRLDCRGAGASLVGGCDWDGSSKGLSVGPLGKQITRTWYDTYDALAAIAISRWRAVLVEDKRRSKKNVPTVDTTEPEFQTGTPPRDGRYLCRVDMGLDKPHEQSCDYKDGAWSCFGRSVDEVGKVVSWWPLPDRR